VPASDLDSHEESNMIFKRIRDLALRPQAPSNTLGRADVIPADASWKSRIGASAPRRSIGKTPSSSAAPRSSRARCC
jgi:hypothetical protein